MKPQQMQQSLAAAQPAARPKKRQRLGLFGLPMRQPRRKPDASVPLRPLSAWFLTNGAPSFAVSHKPGPAQPPLLGRVRVKDSPGPFGSNSGSGSGGPSVPSEPFVPPSLSSLKAANWQFWYEVPDDDAELVAKLQEAQDADLAAAAATQAVAHSDGGTVEAPASAPVGGNTEAATGNTELDELITTVSTESAEVARFEKQLIKALQQR